MTLSWTCNLDGFVGSEIADVSVFSINALIMFLN